MSETEVSQNSYTPWPTVIDVGSEELLAAAAKWRELRGHIRVRSLPSIAFGLIYCVLGALFVQTGQGAQLLLMSATMFVSGIILLVSGANWALLLDSIVMGLLGAYNVIVSFSVLQNPSQFDIQSGGRAPLFLVIGLAQLGLGISRAFKWKSIAWPEYPGKDATEQLSILRRRITQSDISDAKNLIEYSDRVSRKWKALLGEDNAVLLMTGGFAHRSSDSIDSDLFVVNRGGLSISTVNGPFSGRYSVDLTISSRNKGLTDQVTYPSVMLSLDSLNRLKAWLSKDSFAEIATVEKSKGGAPEEINVGLVVFSFFFQCISWPIALYALALGKKKTALYMFVASALSIGLMFGFIMLTSRRH